LVDESIITGESEPVFKNTRTNADFTRTNADSIYPNNNRINYPNEKPNNKSFGHDSGNSFGQNSGNNVSLRKSASSLRKSALIPENIALMGTTLIKGEIEGIVFATGKDSYFGSVAKKTLEIEKETAYQKMMTNFAKNIAFFNALLLC
jgi:magnesium-transporting ATPase (P-type)